MNFIGIDPGLQGGIAVVYPNKPSIIETKIMPIMLQGKKKAYDHFALPRFFFPFEGTKCYAILEQQQPMPKQGVTSMFSIGYGFGALKQCLVDFAIPHEVVRAQVWQKEYFISNKKGDTKAQSIQICRDLFPNVNLLPTPKSKKPSDGLADALLIALYAKRRYEGELNAQKRD